MSHYAIYSRLTELSLDYQLPTIWDALSANMGDTGDMLTAPCACEVCANPRTPCTCSSCRIHHPADGLCSCANPQRFICGACKGDTAWEQAEPCVEDEEAFVPPSCHICHTLIPRSKLVGGRMAAYKAGKHLSCSKYCERAMRLQTMQRCHRQTRRGGLRMTFVERYGDAIPCTVCAGMIAVASLSVSAMVGYRTHNIVTCSHACAMARERLRNDAKRANDTRRRERAQTKARALFIARYGTTLLCSFCEEAHVDSMDLSGNSRQIYQQYHIAFCSEHCRKEYRRGYWKRKPACAGSAAV